MSLKTQGHLAERSQTLLRLHHQSRHLHDRDCYSPIRKALFAPHDQGQCRRTGR